jgi:NAD(P)H-dependent FMN reductase
VGKIQILPHIVILSASVRTGRKSHRVALFFKNYIEEFKLATAEIVDLHEYNFPLFEERLKHLKNPDEKTIAFASKIREADGVLIVTPEYNGGYPASLKNVIDLLEEEWYHKPVAVSTVSSGAFGGAQVTTSIIFPLWKLHAFVVPAMFPVPHISKAFDEHGVALLQEEQFKRAEKFLHELLWMVEAVSAKNNQVKS